MSRGPAVSNIAWIAAIVLVLTFLIVVVAWMSSGKLKVENPAVPKENAVQEQKAEPSTFVPEPGTRNARELEPSTPPAREADVAGLKVDSVPTPPADTPAVTPETPPAKEQPEVKKVAETKPSAAEPSRTYALQLGAFSSAENARAFEKRIAGKGYQTTLRQKGDLTAVLITGIRTNEEAVKLKEKLEKENIKSSIVSSTQETQ